MSQSPISRLAVIAGWLLTPLVAWAASLLGGWIGALVAPEVSEGFAPLVWLLAGLFLGAVGGVIVWVWLMRTLSRMVPGDAPSAESDAT